MPCETLHRINHPQAPCPVLRGVPSTGGPLACPGSLGKVADLSLAHIWKWGPHSIHPHRDPTHCPARAPGSPAVRPLEVGLKVAAPGSVTPSPSPGQAHFEGSTVDSWPCPDKWTQWSHCSTSEQAESGLWPHLSPALAGGEPVPQPLAPVQTSSTPWERLRCKRAQQKTPADRLRPGRRGNTALGPFDYLLYLLWALLNLATSKCPWGLLASPQHVSPRPGAAPSPPHLASSAAALLLSFVSANSS